MNSKLKITEQDLTEIVEQIRTKGGSLFNSGQVYEVCYDKEELILIIEVRYDFEYIEVRGSSFEYFNGQVEYERYYEVVNEQYTIESLSAFCEDEELEVPEDLEKRLTNILNNKA